MKKTKLKKIYIDGYKNLIECTTELHDFNVLVGPNNSGKSNFFEIFVFTNAIIFGSDNFKRDIFATGIAPRGDSVCHIDTSDKCRPITISYFLEHTAKNKQTFEIVYDVHLKCNTSAKENIENAGFIKEELSIKDIHKTGAPATLIKRDKTSLKIKMRTGRANEQRIDVFSSALQVVRSIYPGFEELDGGFEIVYDAISAILGSPVIALSPSAIRKLIDSQNKKLSSGFLITAPDLVQLVSRIYNDEIKFREYKDILCQILDFEDLKFTPIPVSKNIRKNSKSLPEVVYFFELKLRGRPYSEIRYFSDGTLVVATIVALIQIEEGENHILNIEEPENCLHPKALNTLISYLKQKSQECQIILTTHSPYLLNSVKPEDVIIARMYNDGGTRFEKVRNIRDLKKRLNKGFINFGDLLIENFQDDNEE